MYFQILEQIKRLVAVGEWRPGEPIPSIRQLAVDLRISVITVKRAYLELEREGVILTQHGKGSIVSPQARLNPNPYEQELAEHLQQVARLASLLRLDPAEVEQRLQEATEEALATRSSATLPIKERP